MLRFLILLISTLFCAQFGSQCLAQDVDKIIKKGIEELDDKNDIIAYNYFLDALYMEPDNEEAKLYAGICHLHLQSPQKALEYLLAVKETEVAKSMEAYHAYLAMAYHLNLEFDKAEKAINNLKDSIPTEVADVSLIKNNISHAKHMYGKNEDYTVVNMGELINTRQHEYGTVAFSDHQTLLYTSRPDLWDQDTLKNRKKLYENVFIVELDSNYNWNEPHYFTNPHLKGNDAVIQVFDNNSKLLTYHNGDLLISNKKEDYWEKGEPIKEIKTPGNESHGYITDNGNTLYFSSNFDSYDGNLNLYVTKKEGGVWSEPQPLVGFNTPYDEDAPFIGEDGYFYFSSKGHNSIGNYDIFRSKYDDEAQSWGEPENLGVPVNSVFDDLYYTDYGRMAYFSSLRPGGNGGLDLYRVLPFKEIQVSGVLTNKETDEIIANATEYLQFGDKSYQIKTDAEGKYELKLPISSNNYFHIAKSEEEANNIVFHFGDSTTSIKLIEVPLAVYSDEIPEAIFNTSPDAKPADGEIENSSDQDVLIAKEENSNNENLVESEEEVNNNTENKTYSSADKTEGKTQPNVEGISLNQEKEVSYSNNATISRIESGKTANLFLYFDTNAAIINEVFYAGLDEIATYLNSDENILIEVAGHTDNVGSENFNLQLSERRAKAVALYLIEKGIEKSRVIARGYGEDSPIASNDDETEGRELNRRVELRKITPSQLSSLSE